MALWRRLSHFSAPGITVGTVPVGRIAAALVVVALIALLAVVVTRPTPPATVTPQIILTAHPFPLIVGNNTLNIQLVGADGAALQAESVRVDSKAAHESPLPLSRPATVTADSAYTADLVYPMTGEWRIDVTAELTNGDTLSEHFDVFVYPVPPENRNRRTTFISQSEMAAIPHDPAREVRIIIPQGTKAGIVGGHGADVIDEEIRLSVSGQNTLIIQNDDIADHSVGPFFVRAGETLRQEFRRPAQYQGACSIRHGAEVNIIVDA